MNRFMQEWLTGILMLAVAGVISFGIIFAIMLWM